MENLIKTENNCQTISVLIPTLNGSLTKLILLTSREINRLNLAYKANKGKNKNIYSLFSESNSKHEETELGMGRLTRQQFDLLLKDKYNSIPYNSLEGQELKKA